MSVLIGRMEDAKGNKGCCIDRHGEVFCQWWLHGHPFCNDGCKWDHPKDLPEAGEEPEEDQE